MASSKKSFVDIDLQGNSLNNSTVGANADMTKAGSFQYATGDNRLEYFDNTEVQQVANLNDITAQSYSIRFFTADWEDNGDGTYSKVITHNLDSVALQVTTYVDNFAVDFSYVMGDLNNIAISANSNPNNVVVVISKATAYAV